MNLCQLQPFQQRFRRLALKNVGIARLTALLKLRGGCGAVPSRADLVVRVFPPPTGREAALGGFTATVHFPLAYAIPRLKSALLELTRNVFPQQY